MSMRAMSRGARLYMGYAVNDRTAVVADELVDTASHSALLKASHQEGLAGQHCSSSIVNQGRLGSAPARRLPPACSRCDLLLGLRRLTWQ